MPTNLESLFKPTTLVTDRFAPYFTADEFVANINALARQGSPQKIMANIGGQRIYGSCLSAQNVNTLPFVKPLAQGLPQDGAVIRFLPERTGKYLITYGVANGYEAREVVRPKEEEN